MIKKCKKGFTLTELMVVVAILGILVAVAAPIFVSVQTDAAEKACDANVRTLQSAITQYSTVNEVSANLLNFGVLEVGTDGKLTVTHPTGVTGTTPFNSFIGEFEEDCPVGGHVKSYKIENGIAECLNTNH